MRILLYGNCHMNALKDILDQQPALKGSVIHAPFIWHIPEQELKGIFLNMNYDVICYQHIGDQYRGGVGGSSQFLKSLAKLIKLPNLYYVQHPEISTFISDDSGKLLSQFYGADVNFLHDPTRDWVNDPNSYSKEFIISQHEKNMQELIERENVFNPDLTCVEWLKENYLKFPIMHTYNHPRVEYFVYLAEELCKILSIPFLKKSYVDTLENSHSAPVYQSYITHLGCHYPVKESWKVLGTVMNRSQMVAYYSKLLQSYSGKEKLLEKIKQFRVSC